MDPAIETSTACCNGSIGVVDGLGLDLQTMFQITSTVDTDVTGFTLRELNQIEVRRQSGLDDSQLKAWWNAEVMPPMRHAIESGNYPRLARLNSDEFDPFDLDNTFRFGLKCVLDGIAVRIAELTTSNERRSSGT